MTEEQAWYSRAWQWMRGGNVKALPAPPPRPDHYELELQQKWLAELEHKSLNPQDVLPVQWSNQPLWKEWDTDNAIKNGLKSSTWVFAAVHKTSRAVASVLHWRAESLQAGQWVPDPTSPIQRHIDRPNHKWTWQHLMYQHTQHILLGGNGLIVGKRKLGNPQNEFTELWTYNPGRITVVPSKRDFIAKYIYTQEDGIKKDFDPLDIMHSMIPDPASLYWGISPLQAAAKAVDVDREAANWQKTSLQNLMVPPIIIVTEGPNGSRPNQKQVDATQARMINDFGGSAKARAPMVMGGVKAIHKVAFTPAEMDFLSSRKFPAREIAAVYGAPLGVIADLEGETYANRAENRSMWYEDTIEPFAKEQAATMSITLQREYGSDTRIGVSAQHTPAMVGKRVQASEAAFRYWQMGWDANEVSESLQLGMPRQDVPRRYIPANMEEVGAPGESFDPEA